MPRNYKRKTERQSWSEKSMAAAIKDVTEGRMGYKKAAITHDVPQSTLEDKIKKAKKEGLFPLEAAQKRLGRYKTVFSEAQEEDLVKYILFLKEGLYGLTLTDVRKLAFQVAEKNNIPHTFNREKERAGKDWLYSFLSRHKELSFKNPEKTSFTHMKDCNHTAV